MKVALTFKAKPIKKTTTLTAPSISYTTAVDPGFTQATNDPLQVTYTVTASATETVDGVTENLGSEGELPDGILDFYSQGVLECSVNVGGATTSSPCTITYPATGSYQVTTEYIPTGATAVTQTETETISPFATTTTMAASVVDSGTSDVIGLDAVVQGPSGADVSIGNPDPLTESSDSLDYTITDVTTGQVLGYVIEPIGEACAITLSPRGYPIVGDEITDDTCDTTQGVLPNSGGVMYVNDPSDSLQVTASYPGGPGYDPSPNASRCAI